MTKILATVLLMLSAAAAMGQANTGGNVPYYNTGNGTVTAAGIQGALTPLTGCSTANYVYSPQNGTCVAAGGSSVTFPAALLYGSGSTAAPVAATAAQVQAALNGSLTLGNVNNVRYLTCSSDLGAQVTSAAAALSSGGVIVFPNCTTATWTTATSQVAPNISFVGYGQRATLITCSVAGDCLDIHQPTGSSFGTLGEIGSEIAGFTMVGSGSSTQTLIHGEGLGGYTIHDVALDGSPSASVTTCMHFENTTSGNLFTEGNNSYNFEFGAKCAPAVFFDQDSGDTYKSWGYNNFSFHLAATNGYYGVVFGGTGSGSLYNGRLEVYCNHVGPNGGCINFTNAWTTNSNTAAPMNEIIYVGAEEDGTGSGVLLNSSSTGTLSFSGQLNNGSATANPLATVVGGSGTVYVNNALQTQGTSPTAFTTALDTDTNYGTVSGTIVRQELCPNLNAANGSCGLVVGTDTATNGDQIQFSLAYRGAGSTSNRGAFSMFGASGVQVDESSNVYVGTGTNANLEWLGGHTWQNTANSTGQFYWYDTANNTTALSITSGTSSGYNNAINTTSGGIFGFSSTSQFANNTAADTGISRNSADVIDMGNGTQGDASALVREGTLQLTGTTAPTMVAGSAAGTSPSCTSVTGNNTAMLLSCTTGTSTNANATLATITFNGTLATAPRGCLLMPRNITSAGAMYDTYTTAPSTTSWTIAVGGTAFSSSTTYSWSVICL